ncbi:MAG TPA: ImmA/IrrE family metallo-endopeptidase [Edaphobacter sp.]|nr:ImmA/IrrE family metallo-endopeptidase [Edaphobacter sp.]
MRVKKLKRSLEIDAAFRFQAMEPLEYGGPAGVARLVRQMWQMPPGPVRDLIQVIEDAGGIVIEFDFGTKQADAISEWVPNSPPIFVLNSNAEISWDRRRLTLAHELGHIILHKLGPNPQMEDEANEFAAEFLMPRREIKPSLYGLTMAKLRDLKRYWKVSMQALVERAYQLKTITLNQRKYFYISLNKNGHTRVHEPMEFEFLPEKPQLFHSMLRAHLEKLDYSMRELATLLFFEEAATLEAELFGEKGPRLIVA